MLGHSKCKNEGNEEMQSLCLGGLNTLQQIRADTPTPSLDRNMKAKKELERVLKLQVAVLASLYQFHAFNPLVSSLTRRRNIREENFFP